MNFKYFIVKVFVILFLTLIVFRLKVIKVYAWNIPTFRICVYTNGTPLPSSAGGFIRYGDKLGMLEHQCESGNMRFLEIGKTESPNGNRVDINDNYSNCAEFFPWEGFNDHQKIWLHSQTVNVPELGSKRRSPDEEAASFGCSQNPLDFGAFVNGYICDRCNTINIQNKGGNMTMNLNCNPINSTPTISIPTIPSNCFTSDRYTFTLRASDGDGIGNLTRLGFRISDNDHTQEWVIFISHGWQGGYTAIEYGGSGGHVIGTVVSGNCGNTACDIGNNTLEVKFQTYNLDELVGAGVINASATDILGASSGWRNMGSFQKASNIRTTLSYLGEQDINWDTSNITVWPTIYDNFPPYNFASLYCCLKDGNNEQCSNEPKYCTCNALPSGRTSQIVALRGNCTFSGGNGTYRFIFAVRNECTSTSSVLDVDIISADPWMMTAFGDSYSFNGYDLEMQLVTFPVLKGNNNEAYFSSYIISNRNNNIVTERPSFRSYILRNYSDLNRDRTGNGFNIYSQLLTIASSNGCNYQTTLPATGCPNGSNVYFIGNSVSIPNSWLQQQASSSRACAIVSSANITIPAGIDAPDDIDKMDAFFISQGTFITEADSNRDILYINGSVIANTVDFRRIYRDSLENPSEIIVYDPKYIDLLRNCFGQEYEYKIREYEYSNPIE